MNTSARLSCLAVVVGCVSCGPEAVPGVQTSGRFVVELRAASPELEGSPILLVEQRPRAAEKRAVTAAVPVTVEDSLDELPMLVVHVTDLEVLRALESHPLVANVWPEEQYELFDAESFPFIGQPATLDAGVRGTGATVAVLDTGLDYTKSGFGSCATVGAAGCSVAYVQDFAPNDGQRDDNGHGTNVSGIVMGMAPGARVIGLDVFTGTGASSVNIISAINWVIANRGAYNIVAMNLSLGGGSSTTPCASDVFATPIASARAAGVLAAIASGNNGTTNAISSPACVPTALSVGAVYDSSVGGVAYSTCTDSTTAANKVTCFSNSAPFLSVLAPGAFISAAGITMSGTSQATPHVAGAIALLASKYPTDTPSKRASRLLSGGTWVTDARTGLSRPRLTLGSTPGACSVTVTPETVSLAATAASSALQVAVSGTGCKWSLTGLPTWLTANASTGTASGAVTLSAPLNTGIARVATFQLSGVTIKVTQAADVTPPTGTATAPAVTKVVQLPLSLSATDSSGVSAMCLSTTTSCTTWVAYSKSATATLPAGDGVKTVYVWFRDAPGNASKSPLTVTTRLDATAPVNGVLTAARTGTTAKLSWSGFSDVGSGVAKYRLLRSTTTTDVPVSCTSGTLIQEGTALTATVTVASKTTARFRVCALDVAGNVSTGAVVTVTTP